MRSFVCFSAIGSQELLKSAISIKPDHHDAYIDLGDILLKVNRVDFRVADVCTE